MRAISLNQAPCDEPSARRVEEALIQKIIEVCREAMAQQECPANSATAALVTAVKNSELRLDMDPVLREKINVANGTFPFLKFDEIRVVMMNEKLTDTMKTSLLSDLHRTRILENREKGVIQGMR